MKQIRPPKAARLAPGRKTLGNGNYSRPLESGTALRRFRQHHKLKWMLDVDDRFQSVFRACILRCLATNMRFFMIRRLARSTERRPA